ncbi:MAG TPA: superinfection immunity protein [Microlunatus sp.]
MSYPPSYGSYPPVHTQIVAQPYRSSTAHLVVAWVITVLTLGYTLPWAIAATRNKSNTAAIAVINILLGWSLIGWIVALVMSLTSEPPQTFYVNTAVYPAQPPLYGPQAAQAPALPPAPTYGWAPADQPAPPTYHPEEPTAILPPYPPEPWQRRVGESDHR